MNIKNILQKIGNDPMGERKGWAQKPFWSWVDRIGSGGGYSKTGLTINADNALGCSAYYAGVTLIAQTVGQVPLMLYERLEPRGKKRATDNQLYDLLHDAPNPEMPAYTFKETLQGHLLTWGNAYCEIQWDPLYEIPTALWILRPDKMLVRRNEKGAIEYIYTLPNGNTGILPPKNVLHIPGFGYDGLIGYDPLTLWKEAIGLAKAAEEFGAKVFTGANLRGVLTHPDKVSPDAEKRMRASWEDLYNGLNNAHRTAILQEGVTFQDVGMPPEDMQMLQTRAFQKEEIAMILHIPSRFLNAKTESSDYANVEQSSIELVTYCLTPWFTRWEQTINQKLILGADRKKYFSEFLTASLLRGDLKSRYDAYAIAKNNGWLSPDEIRELENMNPRPDGKGGEYQAAPTGAAPNPKPQ
jgi:HK97 family phage portal protein